MDKRREVTKEGVLYKNTIYLHNLSPLYTPYPSLSRLSIPIYSYLLIS